MKFEDAIKVNGKATIGGNGYVEFNSEGDLISNNGDYQQVSKDYFDCDDWEPYVNDKDWNLADNKHDSKTLDSNKYSEYNVRRCRDLILEDISNWDGGDHITMKFVEKRFGDLE